MQVDVVYLAFSRVVVVMKWLSVGQRRSGSEQRQWVANYICDPHQRSVGERAERIELTVTELGDALVKVSAMSDNNEQKIS